MKFYILHDIAAQKRLGYHLIKELCIQVALEKVYIANIEQKKCTELHIFLLVIKLKKYYKRHIGT